MIGGALLALTYNDFRLTPILYGFILLHCIVLMIGGHYTYAEVPLGDWAMNLTGGERNNYDKLGKGVERRRRGPDAIPGHQQ